MLKDKWSNPNYNGLATGLSTKNETFVTKPNLPNLTNLPNLPN